MFSSMKKLKSIILLISVLFAAGCEQEVISLKEPPGPVTPPTPTAGSAVFTKYVAIGTSISAGFQAGALFTDGQNESLAAILATQFAPLNANAAFNQPAINSANGFNSTFSNVAGGVFRGRLILFDPDGSGPRSAGPSPSGSLGGTVNCPSTVITPALPAPYNTAQTFTQVVTPVAGSFNNFSVPGIVLAQILTPATGGPLPPAPNPAFNPYYRRFASSPSADGTTGSTILGDALTAAPTFFTFELGYNDVLGYATTGGVGTVAITSGAAFSGYLNAAFTNILGASATSKGVIANVPDVTKLPFFSLVKWNAIPMDAATVAVVNPGFAGYNQILDALKGPPFNYPAAEVDARKVTFTVSKTNPAVIVDETLNDYGDEFDILQGAGAITVDQRNALVAYEQIRQTTATDLMTLSAGSVLGTCVGDNPLLINGISVPLADQYVLIPTEKTAITDAIAAYNTAISDLVADNPTRLALADLHTAYNNWLTAGAVSVNGILVTPSITPPLAGFSEDAVHPNGKGTAIFANVFIDAINTTFGATLNKADVTKYKGTRTPVNP
jgi:hypothetical protein